MASTSLLMFDEQRRSTITDIYKKVKFPIFGTDCYAYGLLLSEKICPSVLASQLLTDPR